MNHVCICLATFNGGHFLEKQLASLLEQTHRNWSLLISDDGSKDDTINIITRFIQKNPNKQISLIKGPKQGYVKNFLSLLDHDRAIGDFFAFADQDDIWLPGKLEVAVAQLNKVKDQGPKLYGGRTIIIDVCDTKINHSPLFKKEPSFLNALVQNFAGGNTMLFNKTAKDAVQKAGSDMKLISHDWWVYLVISGIGGKVIYDPNPQVLYRDHKMNIIGSNQGLHARMKRISAVFGGQYAAWNAMNVTALNKIVPALHCKNVKALEQFAQFRRYRGIKAVVKGYKTGLYRQTLGGSLLLYLAGFMGRV